MPAFPKRASSPSARPYVRDVLSGLDVVDEVRGLDSLKTGAPVRSLLRDARSFRGEAFDTAVLMTNSFRTAMFALIAGVKRRVGYSRDGRWMLLTDRLRPQGSAAGYAAASMVDYYLALAAVLGAATGDRRMHLAVTAEEAAAADAVLAEHAVAGGRPLAILNPGAAFGSAKCWPPEHFAAVADALAAKGFEPLVVTSPKEAEIAERIAVAARTALRPVWRSRVGLGTLKALIARAAVLVTNDSGPRHFGAALGRPVVTLMGPTDPRWSDTGYSAEIILNRNVECAPCMLRVCPRDHACMRLITPDEVVAAVERLLAAERREVSKT